MPDNTVKIMLYVEMIDQIVNPKQTIFCQRWVSGVGNLMSNIKDDYFDYTENLSFTHLIGLLTEDN